ncbi:MAG: hypothetical protein IJ744_00600 [Lachnospiraceae bacterium]|nr:hypothetical protein [Lachnospiraceae bacterium]
MKSLYSQISSLLLLWYIKGFRGRSGSNRPGLENPHFFAQFEGNPEALENQYESGKKPLFLAKFRFVLANVQGKNSGKNR